METEDIDSYEQYDYYDHKRKVMRLAYGIILLLLFMVGASCCDPNTALPPKATPLKGFA
jgi:hypothetical protein